MTASRVTLASQAEALGNGGKRARDLAEQALAGIDAQIASGCPAFMRVDRAAVLREADASDSRRKVGKPLSPYDGIPYAVKDLFDVEGEVTTAGSAVLRKTMPAAKDSDAVARLRAKGFVALGRTNMTEFAYSGLGLNPHYGTPPSVYGASGPRIPGGSSSGTAVAVAAGICSFGLGTDTGGSCRIPAAFNGIAGYKPTALRVSKRGVFPLSDEFDSIGPLATSMACCAAIDGILADVSPTQVQASAESLKIAVLQNYVLDDLDQQVAVDFERSLSALSQAGVELVNAQFPEINKLPALLKNGGIVAYEASRAHAARLVTDEAAYDPRVSSRIKFGFDTTPVEYAALLAERQAMIAAFHEFMKNFDAVACPTVPMIAPLMTAFADETEYRRLNARSLRNTYVFNFLDGCSGSLPMNREGEPPTGLMLSSSNKQDGKLLAAMKSLELRI